jgi:heme/copper-type cytochrome/quinol oxidase subunit 2
MRGAVIVQSPEDYAKWANDNLLHPTNANAGQ